MITDRQVETLLNDFLATAPFEDSQKEVFVVELTVRPGNKISLFVDSMQGLTIKDCVSISRYIERNFDREVEDFELQVSSAGIDLPLRVVPQYIKNIGQDVEVLTTEGEKIKARLESATAEGIVLSYETKIKEENAKRKKTVAVQKEFTYSQIKTTKVIPSFSGLK